MLFIRDINKINYYVKVVAFLPLKPHKPVIPVFSKYK